MLVILRSTNLMFDGKNKKKVEQTLKRFIFNKFGKKMIRNTMEILKNYFYTNNESKLNTIELTFMLFSTMKSNEHTVYTNIPRISSNVVLLSKMNEF